MSAVPRLSPIDFTIPAARTEQRDGWRVVLEYPDEGTGPFIVDLSHLPRWDVQDRAIDSYRPFGMPVPARAGECAVSDKLAVTRMNRTQATVWHLAVDVQGFPADDPAISAFTDIRENTLCLAVLGPGTMALSEKITRLDLADPAHKVPCLIQGPLAHIPCQVLLLSNRSGEPCFLFTCSRGYGRDMVHAILAAGAEFGLRPAGEKRFREAATIKKMKKEVLDA